MSLLKFLLGSTFQREKWKKRKEQEVERINSKIDLSDPHQKRELMNCIAYSPGIPNNDGRLVDNWEDDSLTTSECSTVTDFENVITVVEVHPQLNKADDTQDELDPEEVGDEGEASNENSATEEHSEELESREEENVKSIGLEDKDDNNFDGNTDSAEHFNATDENSKGTINDEDCIETQEESKENAEEDTLNGAEDCEIESTSSPRNSSICSEEEQQREEDSEEDLPDQIVPDLSGSSESTGSTTLTPAPSIEMETQTESLAEPKETETQTDEIPAAVSLRPNHRYQSHPHEMRLLSVALSELEADMLASSNQKGVFRACSCSGNTRPTAPSPNVGFSVEKNRQIARENANLLSRLQRTQSRIKRQNAASFRPPESSHAINRRKQQEKIQRENLILLRKITDARGANSKKAGSSTMLSSYC